MHAVDAGLRLHYALVEADHPDKNKNKNLLIIITPIYHVGQYVLKKFRNLPSTRRIFTKR